MIENLRRRFIAITMLSVFLVLLLLMGAINVENYRNIVQRADRTTSAIATGHYQEHSPPPPPMAPDQNRQGGNQPAPPPKKEESLWDKVKLPTNRREQPRDASYFTVIYSAGGENPQVTISPMWRARRTKEDQMTETLARQMAEEIVKSGHQKGFKSTNRYLVVSARSATKVVVLARHKELENFYQFLFSSILWSLISLLLVFLLVLLFSRRAIRPVAESYQKQKTFITNAGHELKTPLAIIDSCTEVIEMDTGETKWTEGIHEQVRRLTTMTGELVDLSRMDEGGMDLDMRDFDFSAAAEETLRPFTLLAEEQGKTLTLDLKPGILLFGNARTLKQLCSILADNAVKYATDGSEIVIRLYKKGHKVVLSSFNRAEGITKGSHNEFFDRFYRGDSSHSSSKMGYGIGLSMARSIVLSHGGRITAVSEDGNSLLITAALPETNKRKKEILKKQEKEQAKKAGKKKKKQ